MSLIKTSAGCMFTTNYCFFGISKVSLGDEFEVCYVWCLVCEVIYIGEIMLSESCLWCLWEMGPIRLRTDDWIRLTRLLWLILGVFGWLHVWRVSSVETAIAAMLMGRGKPRGITFEKRFLMGEMSLGLTPDIFNVCCDYSMTKSLTRGVIGSIL